MKLVTNIEKSQLPERKRVMSAVNRPTKRNNFIISQHHEKVVKVGQHAPPGPNIQVAELKVSFVFF